MKIIWWSKHVGVILSVLVCDIWINVLLQTSALVGPLYIILARTVCHRLNTGVVLPLGALTIVCVLFCARGGLAPGWSTVEGDLQNVQTNLLNNSMEQSPSWEANISSASHEIPCIWWNPNVRCRIYNRPPSIPVLSQISKSMPPNPISWRSIVILSSHLRLGLPSGLIFRGSPHQTSPVSHTCHIPRPSHSLWFDQPNEIWCGTQIIKFLVM
jgi:hypothetical protein